jgi:hypothetical protein
MVLTYGEARGHSELARQIYGDSKDTSQCTNLCKRCTPSLRFGAPTRISFYLQKKIILYEIENQPRTSTVRDMKFRALLSIYCQKM